MTRGEEPKALLGDSANSPTKKQKQVKHWHLKERHAMIAGEPVLLFDNKSSDSHPPIELLTIAEMAELLKISITGVRRLQQRRCIPFIKVGGSVRFAISDIASYLEKRRVESIDQ